MNIQNLAINEEPECEIVSDYQLLHFDEFPILFTGTDKFGSRLIATFADYTEDEEIYFYYKVTPQEFELYRSRRLSLRSIIDNYKFIYAKVVSPEQEKTYRIIRDSSVDKYLPLSSSYIPVANASFATTHSLKLEGYEANKHKVEFYSFVDLVKSFHDSIKRVLHSLHASIVSEINLSAENSARSLFISGSVEVDFDLNVSIKRSNKKTLQLFNNRQNYENFTNEFLATLNTPTDQIESSYEGLSISGKSLLNSLGYRVKDNYDVRMRNNLSKAYLNLYEGLSGIGREYNSVKIFNQSDPVLPLVDLQQTVYHELPLKAEKLSNVPIERITGTFTVLVYQLNINSNRGKCYIEYGEENAKSVGFIVLSNESTAGSKLSLSLHSRAKINVSGTLLKHGKKLIRFNIDDQVNLLTPSPTEPTSLSS